MGDLGATGVIPFLVGLMDGEAKVLTEGGGVCRGQAGSGGPGDGDRQEKWGHRFHGRPPRGLERGLH